MTKSNVVICLLFAVFFSLFIISCSSGPVMKQEFMSKEELLNKIDKKDYPTSEDYKDFDGVVLYENTSHEIYLDPSKNLNALKKVKVIKKIFKNLDDFSKYSFSVDYYETLVDWKARVIKQDGSIYVLSKEDIITSTSKMKDEKNNENKKITLVFPKLENNSIIELNYTLNAIDFVMGDYWILQYNELPVIYSEYKLIAPKNIKFTYKASYYSGDVMYNEEYSYKRNFNYRWLVNLNNIKGSNEPQKFEDKDKYIALWAFKDIPPFNPEPHMPPHDYNLATIIFNESSEKGWKEISEMCSELLFGVNKNTDERIINISDSLTKNCKTDIDKINNLKNYVQQIRYEAVGFGIGGIKPRKPIEVIEKSYGDCKDKSMLLVSLLKAAKISSNPVLLLTADKGLINTDFPYMRFNHVIVLAKDESGKEHWIDPTVTLCPLDQIPWADEGVNGFVLYEDGSSKFKITPLSNKFDNRIIVKVKEIIQPDESTKYYVNMTCFGNDDLHFRNGLYDANETDRQKSISKLLKDEFKNVKIDSLVYGDFKDFKTPFNINFQLVSDNSFSKQGNIYFMNFDPVLKEIDNSWITTKERNYAIFEDYPYTIEKEFSIEFPNDKYDVGSLPDNVILKDPNIDYEKLFFKINDNKVSSNIIYSVNNSIIPKEKYKDLKNIFSKISTADKTRLIFNKKSS